MHHVLSSRTRFMLVLPILAMSAISLSCERTICKRTAPPKCRPDTQLPCNCPCDTLPSACVRGGVQFPNVFPFEDMSARSWYAFNWPVSKDNGVPNYKIKLNDPPGDHSTVWESWKSTSEVFLPDGKKPSGWDSRERELLPAPCTRINVTEAEGLYDHRAKVPRDLPPRLLTSYLQADGNPLIDHNGQPVRYEKAMNKVAFDYIVKNGLYSREGIVSFFKTEPNKIDFPAGGEVRGAYLVKAAWKVLKNDDDPDDFHKAWAYVTPPFEGGVVKGDGCSLVPVGLVGMHIIYKTEYAPHWAWATFEHVRNAPTWSKLGDAQLNGESYHFFDRKCNQTDCAELNAPPLLESDKYQRSQIVMQQDFGFACQGQGQCAPVVKGLSNTVWNKYELKGTQWVDDDPVQNFPMVVSNSVIESYFQATSSCLSCHSTARTKKDPVNGSTNTSPESDRLFIFRDAQSENPTHQGDVR